MRGAVRGCGEFWAAMRRRLGWDRNPLRRPSDRVGAGISAVMVMVCLVGVPAVALYAGQRVYRADMQTVRVESVARHPARAVLLTDAPSRDGNVTFAAPRRPFVHARWTAPDGTVRTGDIPASPGARTGSVEWVWVDGDGHLTSAPLTPGQARSQSWSAALFAALALILAAAAVRAVARQLLDRRNLAAWEREWAMVEPRWSGRRRTGPN